MASHVASIQSFFQPEAPSTENEVDYLETIPADSFTSSEVEAGLQPTFQQWQPRTTYRDVEIAGLMPGPACVAVMGRIINFYDQPTPSKMPQAAKGCLKIIIRDDTGAFAVKLWYAKVDYQLRLGHLVSIWTPYVSTTNVGSLILQEAPFTTSIFPERDNSCSFLIQKEDDEDMTYKTPLGYNDSKHLAGLITLRNFIDGGYKIADVRILVGVKSIGAKKRFMTKKGNLAEKVDVHVSDDTADSTLTLWGCTGTSASAWKPSYTILLLSRPGFNPENGTNLSLKQDSQVDVNPLTDDACWLRGHMQGLKKREHVNQPFPENMFDVETAASSESRILFTLAYLDEFARAAPTEQFIGYLNLTIVEMHIFSLYQRNMMLCAECCGVPIFANAVKTRCKQCEKEVPLRINPRLVGLVVDESGGITSGKIIWSGEAWWQLLGRTPEELANSNPTLLKYLENRLLFLKLVVMFGWNAEVGKLVALRVDIV